MNIFVLNRGSSTIKVYLYRINKESATLLWQGQVEWKNAFSDQMLTVKTSSGAHLTETLSKGSKAIERLVSYLVSGKTAVLHSLDEVSAVAHRIVHGGKEFRASVVLTPKVKEKIRSFSELAPLHNPLELEGVDILQKLFSKSAHVAVFDTAFHHTLPKAAQVYPGPYQWFEKGIQRYGFHGISFQYCSKRAQQMLGKMPSKMVICHLGSGASLCALKEGQSIDTTMGFTPLEGLMMDTRCGSIDPGILLYLLKKKGMSIDELSQQLYHNSGLLGVSGFSSDMRDILEKSAQNDPRATLALDVYLHRLSACLGSMIASLQGIDTLAFTAGIGENAPLIRKRICAHFSFLGLDLDPHLNDRPLTEDTLISKPHSKVQLLLIHTQEALEMARECLQFLQNG